MFSIEPTPSEIIHWENDSKNKTKQILKYIEGLSTIDLSDSET